MRCSSRRLARLRAAFAVSPRPRSWSSPSTACWRTASAISASSTEAWPKNGPIWPLFRPGSGMEGWWRAGRDPWVTDVTTLRRSSLLSVSVSPDPPPSAEPTLPRTPAAPLHPAVPSPNPPAAPQTPASSLNPAAPLHPAVPSPNPPATPQTPASSLTPAAPPHPAASPPNPAAAPRPDQLAHQTGTPHAAATPARRAASPPDAASSPVRGSVPASSSAPPSPVRSPAPTRPPTPTRSRAHPGGIANVLEILGTDVQPHRARKPPWFKVPAPGGPRYRQLQRLISEENLHTVCQEAACPNIGECWQRGTATFMILGDICTRRCGFCNVKTGKPTWNDPLEPARVARSVARMGLRHAVITSVDRDDLPDYGASAFVGVIRQIRRQAPGCRVEVLTPDFRGEEMPLAKVIAERPDVFNHNVEVVPRLYPLARRGSRWQRSLRVLRNAKALGGGEVITKSGLMVGLGETFEELLDALGQLREHHVQVITVGQYLRPTERHLPIVRYWHPDEFAAVERAAYALGFEHVAAGPLVRSSYHADQHIAQPPSRSGPAAPSRASEAAAGVAAPAPIAGAAVRA